MNEPKVNLSLSSVEWNDLLNTTFGSAPAQGAANNLTASRLNLLMNEQDRLEKLRRSNMWDYDPGASTQRRQEQYERDRIEGMVGDMVRRRVRAELDRMNSTRTAMVQLEVCAEGGFTVVHNGCKYACADTQAMTERIVAITAVMAMEHMDKGQP